MKTNFLQRSLKCFTLVTVALLIKVTTHAQTNDKMILKSLSAAYEVPSAGMYKFVIADAVFEAYVDGDGNILVINDEGGSQGMLPQMNKLSLQDRGVLSPSILKHLGKIEEVVILTEGAFMATSDPSIIKKLKSFQALHSGKDDNAIHQSWTGGGANYVNGGAYCISKNGRSLDSNVIDVCGNANGMKWSPAANTLQLAYSKGDIPKGIKIQLWVKGVRIQSEKAKEDIEYLNTIQSVHHDKVLKSLKAASKVTQPGIYSFRIKGKEFSTVVDEHGYVLLAKDNNAYKGPLKRLTVLDDTIRGILAPDFIKKLKGIHQVRITNRDQSFDVNTYYENVIERVVDYHDLSNYADRDRGYIRDHIWGGEQKEGVTLMINCTKTKGNYPLDSVVYDACFTKHALVWSPKENTKTIKYQARKNESELNLWVAAKTKHNKMSADAKRVMREYENNNQVLSLKLGMGFRDGLPIDIGLSKVVPFEVGGGYAKGPYASTSLGLSYMRRMLDNHSFYQGFNLDADVSSLIFNARLRWTSAFGVPGESAHYITPALGIGLMELFQCNFNYRIPIAEHNLALKNFHVTLTFNVPLAGGRFD